MTNTGYYSHFAVMTVFEPTLRDIPRGATGFSQNLEIVLPVNIFEQNFTRICSLMYFRR